MYQTQSRTMLGIEQCPACAAGSTHQNNNGENECSACGYTWRGI